jgi:hypothetical protein
MLTLCIVRHVRAAAKIRVSAACLGSQKQLYGVFQFIVIDELLDLRVCYMWARL